MHRESIAQNPQARAQPGTPLCRMTPILLDLFHALRKKRAVEVLIGWQDAGLLPAEDAPGTGADGHRAGYLLCLAHSALDWGAAAAAEKFRETVCKEEIARLAERRLNRPPRGRPPRTGQAKDGRELSVLLDMAERLPETPLSATRYHVRMPLPRSPRPIGRPSGPTAQTVVRVWCIESFRQLSRLSLAREITLWNARFPELAYGEGPEWGADVNARFRVERQRVRLYLLGNKS